MSSTSSSSDSSDGVKLDDKVLLELLRPAPGFVSLEAALLRLIIAYVPTRRYAPMPSPMQTASPTVPKALPPGPKAPPVHLR